MNAKRFIAALAVLLAMTAVLFFCIPKPGLADAGDFSGDSDFGGGDWDFGSDWDSDSDWDSGTSSLLPFALFGSGCRGGNIFWIVLIIAIISFIVKSSKNKKNGPKPVAASPTIQNASAKQNGLNAIKARDPGFTEAAFLSRVSNMYVQLQDAWEAKKWEPIRIMMTDALYYQFARQLDDYIKNGKTNHIDRISVLSSEILSVTNDGVNDEIKVLLKTRIVDYTTRDSDGVLLNGSKTAEKFMTYEWTMIRSADITSADVGADGAVNHSSCPNCGAPISINQSGQCAYCGSVLTTGRYDWVISAIRAISQVTRG